MTNENSIFLDMTVRELLENFCIMYSPECDYNYGIISYDQANRIADTYDLSDQASVDIMEIIDSELEIECQTPMSWEKIQKIMECLGFKMLEDKGDDSC